MDLLKMTQTREKELLERAKAAMARWKPYIDIVEAHMKSEGKVLQEYQFGTC